MLSVIIPCYNEETLVKKSFNEIFKALKDSKITQYEIIFLMTEVKIEVIQ